MAIDRPMVATTMGIMPYLKSGSTRPLLNSQPSMTTESTTLIEKATVSGRPLCKATTIMKAGNITNSPWAKLIVPEACQSRVKPSAARA
jgi:hypothetical protein